MNFLMDHAHKEMTYVKIDTSAVNSNENELDQDLISCKQQPPTISSLFKLSENASTGALQSIAQQLHIWENAMTGFEERPSTLLKFDTQENVERWKRYATKFKI